MTHQVPCITNVLPDMPSCTYRDEHLTSCPDPTVCKGCEPRQATRGEVCERCYDRIDYAIQIADHLRAKLAGVAHAVTSEGGSSVPGPRLPHTAWQLDLDAIDRAQNSHHDAGEWITTETGAAEAVRFARLVNTADRNHPTVEHARKLQHTYCPRCRRKTVIWQPPDWPGDDIDIACIDPNCGWKATHPEAAEIVTAIETKGAA